MFTMNWLEHILRSLSGAAFLAVFWEAAFRGVRHLLGAQVDLLPPLMVYAGLCGRVRRRRACSRCSAGFGSIRFQPIRWASPCCRCSRRVGDSP